MKTHHSEPAPTFGYPQTEYESEQLPSGPYAAVGAIIGLAIVAGLCVSIWVWHHRNRFAGLLLLLGLSLCVSCKVHKPQHNSPSWSVQEARNEQSK